MIHYDEYIKYHCNPTGLRETYRKTIKKLEETDSLDEALVKADWVDRYYLIKIVESYRHEHPSLNDRDVFLNIGELI